MPLDLDAYVKPIGDEKLVLVMLVGDPNGPSSIRSSLGIGQEVRVPVGDLVPPSTRISHGGKTLRFPAERGVSWILSIALK
ncbi:hypothetical protein ACFWNG_29965 [Streptomyces sp. NPDC058391]|uniref:hypothetical protein n=1 Tax=Streptomyces sp. NPDC058391 TaxID=3346476 RepID=UPI0036622A2D